MRTLTEIHGKSLELVHKQWGTWKKEIADSLKASLSEGLEETVTTQITETITARVTESLTKRYTESETARLTNEGKTSEEIEATLPDVIKTLVEAGLKVELPNVLHAELAKAVKEAMKHELDTKLKEGVQAALEAKIAETQKCEGDKLAQFMVALKLTEGKFKDLKRVVVSVPLENEKAPATLTERDGKFYLVEYFPSVNQKRTDFQAPVEERGGRGGRDKKGGRGGRDDKKGRNPSRENREPRPQATPNGIVIGVKRADSPVGDGVAVVEGARAPRPPRERTPRAPRAPRPPREPRPQATPNGIVIGAGGKLMKKEDMPVMAAAVTDSTVESQATSTT